MGGSGRAPLPSRAGGSKGRGWGGGGRKDSSRKSHKRAHAAEVLSRGLRAEPALLPLPGRGKSSLGFRVNTCSWCSQLGSIHHPLAPSLSWRLEQLQGGLGGVPVGCPHPGRTPPPPGLFQPCPGVTLPKSSQAKQGPPSPGWGPAGTGPDPPGSSCGNRHEPKAHVSTGGGHREQPPPPPLPGAALAAASPKRGWGGAGSSRGGSGCQAQPGTGRWVLHVGTPSTAQPGAPRGAGCTSVPHRPDTRVRGSGSIHRSWG